MFVVPIGLEKMLHLMPKGGRIGSVLGLEGLLPYIESILQPESVVVLGAENSVASSIDVLLCRSEDARDLLPALVDDGFLILVVGADQTDIPALDALLQDSGFTLLAMAREPSQAFFLHRYPKSIAAKGLTDRIAYNVPRISEIRECGAGTVKMKRWVAEDGDTRIVPTFKVF